MPYFLRRMAPAGLIAALVVGLAACGGGASFTPLPSGAEPPSDCARVEDGVVTIGADDLEFDAPCMVAIAGEAFTIHFENRENVPHDVAVYTDSSKENEIMRGDIITGPDKSIDYDVPAQDAGTYYFVCTVHPAMNGALYVVDAEAS
jgi:plastocyanin